MAVLVDECEELKSCVIAGERGAWCCCSQEVQRHRAVVGRGAERSASWYVS
jgi:hypothetical protein